MIAAQTLVVRRTLLSSRRSLLHSSSSKQTSRRIAKRIVQSAKGRSSSTAPVMNLAAPSHNNVLIPSNAQLKALFISSAIPMVAFGFMDNSIMIFAGSYIDSTFGAALGLATLSAAALGQVVSDVSGVIFGNTVERLLSRLGLIQAPCLTGPQRRLPLVRNVQMAGGVVGVICGCLLGASSLLFMDLHKQERLERTQQLHDIFTSMLEDEQYGIACRSCRVHLSPQSRAFELGTDPTIVQQLQHEEDAASRCALKQVMILQGSTLYVPVVHKDETLGVLEFCKATEEQFSAQDEHNARVLARHVGIFMARLQQS